MEEHMEKLGRRAANCHDWKWLEGTKVWTTTDDPEGEEEYLTPACRIVDSPDRYGCARVVIDLGVKVIGRAFASTLVPDFSDPASYGALLRIAREAWGDQSLNPRAAFDTGDKESEPLWIVSAWRTEDPEKFMQRNVEFRAETEAEALVASLEFLSAIRKGMTESRGGQACKAKPTRTEIYEIGRRALACKNWLWMAGMNAWATEDGEMNGERVRVVSYPWNTAERSFDGDKAAERDNERVYVVSSSQLENSLEEIVITVAYYTSALIPDFTDPASKGCLNERVRSAWKCSEKRQLLVLPFENGLFGIVVNERDGEGGDWRRDRDVHPIGGSKEALGNRKFKTEVEALVAALEAAP
jgi:hypothetical protein